MATYTQIFWDPENHSIVTGFQVIRISLEFCIMPKQWFTLLIFCLNSLYILEYEKWEGRGLSSGGVNSKKISQSMCNPSSILTLCGWILPSMELASSVVILWYWDLNMKRKVTKCSEPLLMKCFFDGMLTINA